MEEDQTFSIWTSVWPWIEWNGFYILLGCVLWYLFQSRILSFVNQVPQVDQVSLERTEKLKLAATKARERQQMMLDQSSKEYEEKMKQKKLAKLRQKVNGLDDDEDDRGQKSEYHPLMPHAMERPSSSRYGSSRRRNPRRGG